MTWHWDGDDRVAIIVVRNHHVGHAGSGAAWELAGLVGVDLTSYWGAGEKDVVALFLGNDGLLFCSCFCCSWEFEWFLGFGFCFDLVDWMFFHCWSMVVGLLENNGSVDIKRRCS